MRIPCRSGISVAERSLVPRSIRVLLVEDDTALAELFAQILDDRGHAVRVATDVESAKALLAGERFDAVVADLRLPGASGLELLAWVQRHDLRLRVILASAFTTQELSIHARRLGAAQVLSKPVEPADLVSAVEAA